MADNPEETKRPPGRPVLVTELVVQKLEAIFQQDVTIEVACNYAGIGVRTYHDHYAKDEDFRTRIDTARSFARIRAGKVVIDAIDKGDVNTAKWWLEKKHSKEFSPPKDDRPNNTLNIFGDMNLESVVNLSHEQRQQQITAIEAELASLEGDSGS